MNFNQRVDQEQSGPPALPSQNGHGDGRENASHSQNAHGDASAPSFGEDVADILDGGNASSGDLAFADMVEEKKPALSATTLLMLGVSALGGLGVWLMVHRSSAASAAPINTETAEAKQTINAFLGGGSANIKSMEAMLRNTERIVQQFLAYPSMTQVPLSDLHTNPFRLKAPKPPGPNTNDLADRRRREDERVKMLKAVQSLQLQSVMYSDTRKACMIDNVMYREGQQVDVLTIEKITATSVVVRGGVYRFELKMQR